MRQAIMTKYLGPTNYRGSRVKASAQDGSIIVNWDYASSTEANHKKALQALLNRLGWNQRKGGKWIMGSLPNGQTVHIYCADHEP
jgi:hypothetical protein